MKKIVLMIILAIFAGTLGYCQMPVKPLPVGAINELGDISHQNFRALPYVKVVKILQWAPRADAVKLLRRWAANKDNSEKIVILCRMLYEPKEKKTLRRPVLGNPVFIGGGAPVEWPLEPIVIYKNVPVSIVSGYALSGPAEKGSHYLEYSIKNGVWTTRKYLAVEEKEVALIVDEFIQKNNWPRKLDDRETAFLKEQGK